MSEKMISVLRAKTYERAEAKQINRIIQDGEVVLEIGAGIGFISALVAKHPMVERIVSYEANPLLIDVISETLKRNAEAVLPKWEVRNAVLKNGSVRGEVDFYVHRDFWASSLTPIANPARIEKVPVESFNSLVRELRPTLIICDIEGGELELFRNSDLTDVRKVYVETHQKKIGRRGMKELFEIFHARGFHYDQHHSEGSVVLFSHVDRDGKR